MNWKQQGEIKEIKAMKIGLIYTKNESFVFSKPQ
jgi:hypothetical protein